MAFQHSAIDAKKEPLADVASCSQCGAQSPDGTTISSCQESDYSASLGSVRQYCNKVTRLTIRTVSLLLFSLCIIPAPSLLLALPASQLFRHDR
jgi:hypothetical protein